MIGDGVPAASMRNPPAAGLVPRELRLEELLAAPVVRRMMERDGVELHSLRALIVAIAHASANSRYKSFGILYLMRPDSCCLGVD
jgi:hypothetical protein